MKSLVTFLNEELLAEASLTTADFPKHNYKYIKGLLSKLLDGQDVRLGAKGESGTVNVNELTNEEQQIAKAMLDELNNGDYADISVPRFISIFASKKLRLSNFFKGDCSGYVDGLESKNKGNAFESYFIKNYAEKFENDIKSIIGYNELNGISADGGLNTLRPLTFDGNSLTVGKISGNDFNIGRAVTDITLDTDKGPIYLSLKYGKSTTFANAGIAKLFPKSYFSNADETAKGNAKVLLDMLCIDEEKFKNVFNNYSSMPGKRVAKAAKETVDILKEIKSNALFERFIKSVMGCGYILVHQIKGDDVEYIDLLTPRALDKYIKDIKEAYIEYPLNGEAKRVDVIVKYDSITFKLNIRSKNGGIYPTHLMADYTFA